jgi:endonuclease YncB( thermonuclease family)
MIENMNFFRNHIRRFSVFGVANTNTMNTMNTNTMNTNNNGIQGKGEEDKDIRWEDTQEFVFPIAGGKVIKVYDADTITIAARLPYPESPLYRFAVRLNGIDTPEMKGKDVSEEEKEAAKVAREFVYKLVFQKKVRLENVQNEKYGRILADVYVGDIHLNKLLLDERYAVTYKGGTKQKPVSWSVYKNTGEMG